MSIDWITVAAQIANFLVLVWLLKRFLYRPILDGIDAREAEIARRMQDALTAEQEAKAAEADFQEQSHALQRAQSDLTDAIRREAEKQRDAVLAEARAQIEKDHAARKAHLDDEARQYAARLHHAGAGALLALTRKALIDLADETLEARMAQRLMAQLPAMEADLRHAAGETRDAVVTSHDPLPQAAQDSLTKAMHAMFPDVTLRFAAAADQAPGLVLRLGGVEVAWTVEGYLDGLEDLMTAELAASSGGRGAAP